MTEITGEGGRFSRRTFLKGAGVATAVPVINQILTLGDATVVAKNVVEAGADYLEKQSVLAGAREFLIRNEAIPPGVDPKTVPNENEHFMFADEMLEKAIARYEVWGKEDNLPPPVFRKSPAYFDPFNIVQMKSTIDYNQVENTEILKEILHNGTPAEKIYQSIELIKDDIEIGMGKTEGFGNMPVSFSQVNISGPNDLLQNNPGSIILNRVCRSLGISSSHDVNQIDNNKIIETLHKEIDPIWAWVDAQVLKTRQPMGGEVFLAGLMYRNRGDITGSLFDKVMFEKLVRNNSKTFEFNMSDDHNQFPDSAKSDLDKFLARLQDQSAPRLSANYVNKTVRGDEMFGFAPAKFKPFDRYSAGGDIYHTSNIDVMPAITNPDFILPMVIQRDFVLVPGAPIAIAPSYGVEKVTGDLLRAYRAPQVRKILDRYSVRQ